MFQDEQLLHKYIKSIHISVCTLEANLFRQDKCICILAYSKCVHIHPGLHDKAECPHACLPRCSA